MENKLDFYIDGKWVKPATSKTLDVINPANEEAYARISLGSKADVDKAVAAARRAFETFSKTSREERLALMGKIVEVYQKHYAEMVETISKEMGAPLGLSKAAQAATGLGHFGEAMRLLKDFQFETVKGSTAIVYEPVGVCGLITPWNWPINQITCKVAPALAAGCTMVLKPSEVAPLSAIEFVRGWTEIGAPPVLAVEIPKAHGQGTRILGVPCVADRVAQTVVARELGKKVEPIFHPDSYGYRPRRGALDAVAACRERCWERSWGAPG